MNKKTILFTALTYVFIYVICGVPDIHALIQKFEHVSDTENIKHRNFNIIDDFEDGVDMWWQPEFSGSTMGIIIEDDVGNPLTYKAHETDIVNPYTGSTGSMKLAFVWDDDVEWVEPAPNGTHSHFVRLFLPANYSMEPERRFLPGQALEVFIHGDGSGNRMRLMVRDGINQLEGSPWQIIDWTGWQRFIWDYNDVANVIGWVTGDGAMTEGDPFFFDSFQVTRNESGTTTEGVFYMDDLRIIDPFSVAFDIIDADGAEIITINDAQYDAGVTDFELFSGEYVFTVEKTGYQTYSGSFVVEDEDIIIEVALTPVEDGQMPGDSNCDGAVNVLDVIAMINYFIGLVPDPFCFENADINGDGIINILDVVATVHLFQEDENDTVMDVDGNVYQTLVVGDYEWMAENLRVTRYNDLSPIPSGLSNTEWENTNIGAYAIFPHDDIEGIDSEEEMFQLYGLFYNWQAVDDARGLCPIGWRIPSDIEWQRLEIFLGMGIGEANSSGWRGVDEGGKLKSIRTEPESHPRWNLPNTLAADVLGFSLLPTGYREHYGTFTSLGHSTLYWTSTSNASVSAWYRTFKADRGTAGRFFGWNNYGFAVRCIRNVADE